MVTRKTKPGIGAVPPTATGEMYQLLQALKQGIEYGTKVSEEQAADYIARIAALQTSLTTYTDSEVAQVAADLAAYETATDAALAALPSTYLKPTTVAELRANSAPTTEGISPSVAWSAAAFVAITYAATIFPDFDSGSNFSITATGNLAIGNPTNAKAGQVGVFNVIASGGSRTINFSGTQWVVPRALTQPITMASGSRNLFPYVAINSSFFVMTGWIEDVI